MQEDFHYYATYCASYLAGFSHAESLGIAYSAQLVDLCTRSWLGKLGAPLSAATTQLQMEMMDARTDPVGLQDITRIWASFHFLPYDLYADPKRGSRRYKKKYRLICGPNGDLVTETVKLAKGKGVEAAGIAMHVLADTWAHRYFAGTPSLVINNTDANFYEIIGEGEHETRRKIVFRHNPTAPDDPEKGLYTNSIYQPNENTIMNLGHGRAGHFPDYSFARYAYLPAWGDYEEIVKDNPADYELAFRQMVYALRFLHGDEETFVKAAYDEEHVAPHIERIRKIIRRRQLIANEDWKAFGEALSGQEIEAFALGKYEAEYRNAAEDEKNDSFLGRFFIAALAQKSMVTNKIYSSGSKLAGYSVNFKKRGFKGIGDFSVLVEDAKKKIEEAGKGTDK